MDDSPARSTNASNDASLRWASMISDVRTATFGEVRGFVESNLDQRIHPLLLESAESLQEIAFQLTFGQNTVFAVAQDLLCGERCRFVLPSESSANTFAHPFAIAWNQLPEDGPCYALVLPHFVLLKRPSA